MYFYPSNQGLLATYVIEMISPTDISPEDKFVVWFPEEFDDTLTASSRRLECWGEPGSIVGLVYECNLKEFRRLEVSGIRNVSEGVPFSIYISNVRNPRIGKLG